MSLVVEALAGGQQHGLEYEPLNVDMGVVVVASESPIVRSVALHVGFSPETITIEQKWRRVYGVVLNGKGILRAVAFAPNRNVFDGLPVLERHDPRLLATLRELDPGLSEVPEPFEMATIKLVDFPSEDKMPLPPETKETLKLMQILRTPDRDKIERAHQIELWGKMAEIMTVKMEEHQRRIRRSQAPTDDVQF